MPEENVKSAKTNKNVIENIKNEQNDIGNASKIVRRGRKPQQNISTHSMLTNKFVIPTAVVHLKIEHAREKPSVRLFSTLSGGTPKHETNSEFLS